ncbi:MAG: hypothetical protein U5J96_12325 [Ignavibacteriaceae bacterium]|nr:hypothetical protein [Ignavibacteriaceae bacterium]
MTTPTVEDVARIAGISDPVIRNLNITQGYYELSRAMSKYTDGNPNWCTFAVWASKQAGQSIRKEDLSRTFEQLFHNSPEITLLLNTLSQHSDIIKNLPEIKAVSSFIIKFLNPDSAFEHSAQAVAEGNKIVFSEIGGEFARFLSVFKSENDFTEENISKFCSAFKPGNPPDGQQMLKDAFTSYFEARKQTDEKVKAEMILYSNLLIGYHEQTRLQPQIVEALDAAFTNEDELKSNLLRELLPGFWLRIRYYVSKLLQRKLPLDEAIDQLLNLAKQKVRETITDCMMTLFIPVNELLKLGEDLKEKFPERLAHISDQKLKELLNKIDPTPDSLKESGAKDWGDLSDRIHFIADLFRAYFENPQLYNQPFTDEQVKVLKEGRKPDDKL